MDDRLIGLSQKAVRMRETLVDRVPALKHFFVNIPSTETGQKLPFLPIRCFRQFNVFSGELPKSGKIEDVFAFQSSGSTNDARGMHYFSESGLREYATASVAGFQRFLSRFEFPSDVPVISLVPPVEVWQKSSLAAMIDMFKRSGFRIEYVNVENDISELAAAMARVGDKAIVFGTSFHHVWVWRLAQKSGSKNLFRGVCLGVVDTGGTKGRTEVFTQDEILGFAQNVYGSNGVISFLSEYGMCELASQAWSLDNPHSKRFACNPSLIPFAIDPSFTRFCAPGEIGFLAFADAMNTDSYPFIITEDLGTIWEPALDGNDKVGVFSIEGRAPDASLKGCSLNVRQPPKVSPSKPRCECVNSISKIIFGFQNRVPQAFSGDIFSRVKERLPANEWSKRALSDLQSTMAGWAEVAEGAFSGFRNSAHGHVAQTVASANIPITWVLPAAAAAWMGFREFHINLPTLREDDRYSAVVISRIRSLVRALTPEMAPMKLHLHTRRMMHPDEFGSNTLLVFGSDATCQTFAQMQEHVRTRILTFGDVWNSMDCACSPQSAIAAASACSAWRGRGCLTPIVLFTQGDPTARGIFCQELANELGLILKDAESSSHSRFLHVSDLLEVRARLAQQGMSVSECIFESGASWVVDLSDSSKPWEFPLRSGGNGLVFVMDFSQKKSAELSWLGAYNCSPRITDKHMGKTWFEWLSLHLNR